MTAAASSVMAPALTIDVPAGNSHTGTPLVATGKHIGANGSQLVVTLVEFGSAGKIFIPYFKEIVQGSDWASHGFTITVGKYYLITAVLHFPSDNSSISATRIFQAD